MERIAYIKAHPSSTTNIFASLLRLTAEQSSKLQNAILSAARTEDAVLGEGDPFGQRYALDFGMTGPKGKVMVRSSWIIRKNEDFPRLTSCYII